MFSTSTTPYPFPSTHALPQYTVAAAVDASAPRRRARSDSDLAALLSLPAELFDFSHGPLSAPLAFPEACQPFRLPEPFHLPVEPLTSSCSAKTFDQLTPEELWRVGMQIGADVLQLPAEHDLLPAAAAFSDETAGPVRGCAASGHRAQRRAQALPYLTLPSTLSPRPASAAAIETPPTATYPVLMHSAHHPSAAHDQHAAGSMLRLRCEWTDCPQEGADFATLEALATHLARHVPHRRSQYPCHWHACPRGTAHPFPKRHKLIAHLRSHTLERPFACDTCGRAFAREDSRDAHLKVHAEDRVGPWGCGCQGGRLWRSWRGVRRHQASGSCAGVARISDVHNAVASSMHQQYDDDLVDMDESASLH